MIFPQSADAVLLGRQDTSVDHNHRRRHEELRDPIVEDTLSECFHLHTAIFSHSSFSPTRLASPISSDSSGSSPRRASTKDRPLFRSKAAKKRWVVSQSFYNYLPFSATSSSSTSRSPTPSRKRNNPPHKSDVRQRNTGDFHKRPEVRRYEDSRRGVGQSRGGREKTKRRADDPQTHIDKISEVGGGIGMCNNI